MTYNQPPGTVTGDTTQTGGAAQISGTIVTQGGAGRAAGRWAAADITPSHVSNPVPAAGVSITLSPNSGPAITVTTGADGTFFLAPDEIPQGIYYVQIHGAGLACDFYLNRDADARALLTEVTADGACYTREIKTGGADWTRDIAPDGAYTVTSGGRMVEEHSASGLTGIYRADGTQTWYIDDNDNFTDDATDPAAPALDSAHDADGDGCHNMRDFDDEDNDNDDTSNFNDNDYNMNLLAANMRSVNTGCLSGMPVFALELEAAPDSGDAPLTVTAKATVRGNPGVIDKYVWITGKPGAEPVETTTPETSITYDQYGAFILTVEVHLTNGEKLIDTHPVTVVKNDYTAGMTLVDEFSASCSAGARCYTHDIDVDQYGNMFVLIDTWSGSNRHHVDILQTDETAISGTIDLDIQKDTNNPSLINMALDKNGFIYTLDTIAPLAVYIHDVTGRLMEMIALDSVLPAGANTIDVKGIAVDDTGNIYFGYTGTPASSIYKCSKSSGSYSCTAFASLGASDIFGFLHIDLEVDPQGNIALLNSSSIDYYSPSGTRVKTHNLSGENMNLAIGPDGTFYVSKSDLGGGISAYSAAGTFLYKLTPGISSEKLVWDMYVDKLGKLYVTTYSLGTVLVYAPEYMAPGAARVATRDTGGFIVHHVKAIALQS